MVSYGFQLAILFWTSSSSSLEYFYCSGGPNDGYSCLNLADVTTCGSGTCVQDIFIDPCGDGYRTGDKQCDTGSANGNDGCSSNCTIETGWTCSGGSATSKDVCEVNLNCVT